MDRTVAVVDDDHRLLGDLVEEEVALLRNLADVAGVPLYALMRWRALVASRA